jgi:hypothetical protein
MMRIFARFGVVVAVALVIASVATPLVLWRSGRSSLREARELSAKAAEEEAQLREENLRLSNLVGQASQALSAEEGQELLRLRSEIGRLRGELREADKLREENQRLKTPSPAMAALQAPRSAAELETELSTQTIDAMKDICRELPAALQKFANDHGQQPRSLPELRNYLPTTDGRKMPGLYTFAFVREEGPQAGDLLILREEGLRGRLDGKMARVYGFRDGSAVEVTSADGNYEAWEKQHLSAPASNP